MNIKGFNHPMRDLELKLKKRIDEKKKEAGVTFYVCDPEKNTECNKSICHINGGPCHHTKNPECKKEEKK